MSRSTRLFLPSVFLTSLVFLSTISTAAVLDTKADQYASLQSLVLDIKGQYGMEEFKNQEFGIFTTKLHTLYKRLIKDAMTIEEYKGFVPREKRSRLTPRQAQLNERAFVAEYRDGHNNYILKENGASTLGLFTAAFDGRLYVTGFSEYFYDGDGAPRPVMVGDEIISLNGESVQDIADRNMLYAASGTYEARRSQSLEFVTLVPHSILPEKREGESVEVVFERKGERFKARYNWIGFEGFSFLQGLFPDKIKTPIEMFQKDTGVFRYGLGGLVRSYFREGLKALPDGSITDVGKLMNVELAEFIAKNPKQLIEPLSSKKKFEANGPVMPTERIPAYIVHHQGKNIGVIRIPSYSPAGGFPGILNEYRWIANMLVRLQVKTDVLIIDQLGNSGGAVMLALKWLGLFGDGESMVTVAVDERITDSLIEREGKPIELDLETGEPIPYAGIRMRQLVVERLKEKKAKGKKFTGLQAQWGSRVELDFSVPGETNPDKFGTYKKPILLLNDSGSASGGDFFPAMMQDNNRAMVMGETSKGLGGPIYGGSKTMPGSEASFRCTAAYCERPGGIPLEGKGTIPDIYRGMTVSDLKDGFKTYSMSVLNAALGVLEGKERAEIQNEVLQSTIPLWANDGQLFEVPEAVINVVAEFRQGLNESQSVPLKKNVTNYAAAYQKLFAVLKEVSEGDTLANYWRQVIIPLPLELRASDVFLKDLWKKGEVQERLRDMLKLKKFKAYHPLIKVIAEESEAFEGNIRFSNPCERLLTNP